MFHSITISFILLWPYRQNFCLVYKLLVINLLVWSYTTSFNNFIIHKHILTKLLFSYKQKDNFCIGARTAARQGSTTNKIGKTNTLSMIYLLASFFGAIYKLNFQNQRRALMFKLPDPFYLQGIRFISYFSSQHCS